MSIQSSCRVCADGVIRSLNINWNKLSIALDDKINFGTAFRFQIICVVAVYGELNIHIVFCHAALVIVELVYHI